MMLVQNVEKGVVLILDDAIGRVKAVDFVKSKKLCGKAAIPIDAFKLSKSEFSYLELPQQGQHGHAFLYLSGADVVRFIMTIFFQFAPKSERAFGNKMESYFYGDVNYTSIFAGIKAAMNLRLDASGEIEYWRNIALRSDPAIFEAMQRIAKLLQDDADNAP